MFKPTKNWFNQKWDLFYFHCCKSVKTCCFKSVFVFSSFMTTVGHCRRFTTVFVSLSVSLSPSLEPTNQYIFLLYVYSSNSFLKFYTIKCQMPTFLCSLLQSNKLHCAKDCYKMLKKFLRIFHLYVLDCLIAGWKSWLTF